MTNDGRPEFWELEVFLNGALFDDLQRCITFVESQIVDFDDRNETEYQYRYGPRAQIAFYIVAVAEMESQLKKICTLLRKMRNYKVDAKDLKGGNGFESCISYLDKVLQLPVSVEAMESIRAVVSIRNALVHQDGRIGKLPEQLGAVAKEVALQDGDIIAFGSMARAGCDACRTFVQYVVKLADAEQAPWRKA